MGLVKTEKELRAETLARRAKHDLKNTPLPVNRRSSVNSRNMKKMFHETNSGEMNKKALNSLMSQRVMSSLTHSKSMTDLRQNSAAVVTRPSIGRHSRSCVDLSLEDQSSLRRSKSYSRITDQLSSYDKKLDSYRSTMTDIFTNVKDYSSKSIAALSSENLLKNIRLGNSAPEASSHSSYEEEKLLRDPCWRAKRIGLEYQPSQYKWREKLGMQERLSAHSLSRSTPNLHTLARLEPSRPERIRTTSESHRINSRDFHYSSTYSAANNLGSLSKSCMDINSVSSSSDYMKKALRQLKVATNWLSSSITTGQQRTEYSHPPPPAATASRWSTPASHNRFSNLRSRFA